ncbi:MAG: ATPase [Bacteroidetes bacterium]|nr:ATPase [Bacteroidota bacterium]
MNHDAIVLGIDGGGTRTRALLAGSSGSILGNGLGGPSNYQAVGLECARESIAEAVSSAWHAAGLPPGRADAAFLGLAGVTSGTDRSTIEALARELGMAGHVGVDHDIRTALAGGIPGRAGLALVAGTGSSCYGRTADGRSWRAGGWGHVLDDVGSGYWFGVRGLAAAVRHLDGRAASTVLSRTLLEHLGISDPETILHLMGTNGLSRWEIAALAPLVIDAALAGDDAASNIVRDGAAELALMAWAVAGRLELTEPEVMLTGGLAENGMYRTRVAEALAALMPSARMVRPLLPPAAGAALLALELMNRHADPDVIGRMAQGLQQAG